VGSVNASLSQAAANPHPFWTFCLNVAMPWKYFRRSSQRLLAQSREGPENRPDLLKVSSRRAHQVRWVAPRKQKQYRALVPASVPPVPAGWEHWCGATVSQLINRIYKLEIWRDRRGQDLLEYALAAGMIAMAGVAAMPMLSSAVSHTFSQVGSAIIANIP